MGSPQQANPLTEAQYLQADRAAEIKSEFFDGEMFAMAGTEIIRRLPAL